ncbi:MAG: hypothetical protein ABI162_12345 [Luteolibacter sp.]
MNKIYLLIILMINALINNNVFAEEDGSLQLSNKLYQIIQVENPKSHEASLWLQRKEDKKHILEITNRPLQSIYWLLWNKEKTAFIANIRISTKLSNLLICKKGDDGIFIKIDKIKRADFSRFELENNKIKKNFDDFILSYEPDSWINEHEFKYYCNLDNEIDSLSYICKINIDAEIIHEEILKSKTVK